MKTIARAAVICCMLLLDPGRAEARAPSSPEQLGGFSGAMQYCDSLTPGSQRRFVRARLNAAREVDGMRSSEKARAIRSRDRVLQRGQYAGTRLDRRSCERLVRAAEWRRFDRD